MALVKIIIISVFYHVDAPRRWRSGLERMPHIERTSVYNDNLVGPLSFTPVTERLTVELSIPIFKI